MSRCRYALITNYVPQPRNKNHHQVSCKCEDCRGKPQPRTTRLNHELAERRALSRRGVYQMPYPVPSRSQGLSKYSALVKDRKAAGVGGEGALESFTVLTPRAPAELFRAGARPRSEGYSSIAAARPSVSNVKSVCGVRSNRNKHRLMCVSTGAHELWHGFAEHRQESRAAGHVRLSQSVICTSFSQALQMRSSPARSASII